MFAFIGMPGPMELAIICGVLVLIFGPKQIPKMARSIGSSIIEFKKGVKGIEQEIDEIKEEINE
jgi:sec-independent protein translocase protein TatA